jgi:predicted polyphosphate/ATP-dependent NAD kinase
LGETTTTFEDIIEHMRTHQLDAEQSFSLIVKIEAKIISDLDALFEALAGAHIHEIQSKIGYAKNLLSMVIDSKGAFDYEQALKSAILQLEDILNHYKKAGVSTQL